MTLSGITLVSSNKSFGGIQYVYSHQSKVLACEMRFGVYVPPQAEGGNVKLPVLYYLSGLSCTEANFIQKAGAQKYAAQHGLIIVNPDTSPRNTKIVGEGADDLIGASAGWYLDSTEEPWKPHYKMFSYVTSELMEMVNSTLPVAPGKQSIMGHSMGGHGAFICALKKPGLYKSVSAFAPIANPLKTDWGVKAFKGYLGEDQSKWNEWDSTELVKQYNGPPLELYIDQGTGDNFLAQGRLQPEGLIEACKEAKIPFIYNRREGYDHGYFYIASFIEEHIKYHMNFLK